MVRLFKALSGQEVKRFCKYVERLYPDYSVAGGLLSVLAELHPDQLTAKELRKERLMPRVAVGKWKRISDESSRLFSWLEDFLLHEKLQARTEQQRRNMLLAEIYREKGAQHLFELKTNNSLQQLQQEEALDPKSFLYTLQLLQLQYYTTFNITAKESEAGELQLHRLLGTLNAFYLSSRMLYQMELSNRGAIFRQPDEDSIRTYAGVQLVERAFSMALALHQPSASRSDYEAFKKFFWEERHAFSPEVQVILQTYGINFASRQFSQGDTAFERELFEVWMRPDEINEMLARHNLLTSTRFINTVTIAIQNGALPWARSFLQKYAPRMPEESRSIVETLGWAIAEYESGALKTAAKRLVRRPKMPPRLEVRARALSLMIDLWQGESRDTVEDGCKRFADYIRRHEEIGPHTQQGFLNFIRLVRQYQIEPAGCRALLEDMKVVYGRRLFLEFLSEGAD